MKHASEDLITEHDAILHGLEILERMASSAEGSAAPDQADLASMVDFLKLFADTCHHGKEEGLLFPAMERHGIPRERGPIGQMLTEHEQGRAFIRGMSSAISQTPLDASAFAANARGYISLLREHIQKENVVLFPMGDRMIPEAEQKQLLEAFDEHERTVMGPGIHERLHALLDSLSAKYL